MAADDAAPVSASLRVAVVGAGAQGRLGSGEPVAADLVRALQLAGHEVRLTPGLGLGDVVGRRGVGLTAAGADVVLLVRPTWSAAATLLAALRPEDRPVVLGLEGLRRSVGNALEDKVARALLGRSRAVIAHSPGDAEAAQLLGASRVCQVPWPTGALLVVGPDADPAGRVDSPDADRGADEAQFGADWAHYVGIIEAVAATTARAGEASPAARADDAADLRLSAPGTSPGARFAQGLRARVAGAVASTRARVAEHQQVRLHRRDFPAWLELTDVLPEGEAGDAVVAEVAAVARSLGLHGRAGDDAGWAALGALAATVRIGDDGRRSALVVDESGPGSPLGRWLRAAGFEPADLGAPLLAQPELDPDVADVIAVLHPHGPSVDDLDELCSQAAWGLRRAGVLVVTVPVGPDVGELGAAELRGLVARADDLGLALVGDEDRLALAARQAGRGLARLTFRRS